VEMSAFYLDILKDRLYTSGSSSLERRSAQTAMYEILITLVQLFAPVLTFTAEEVWQYLPKEGREEISVFLTTLPKMKEKYLDADLENRWERILELKKDVAKALEIARQEKIIGQSLEAAVEVYLKEEDYQFFAAYAQLLKDVFIVSQLFLAAKEAPAKVYQGDIAAVAVKNAAGEKCPRCWTYSQEIGQDGPDLCPRCNQVLNEYL